MFNGISKKADALTRQMRDMRHRVQSLEMRVGLLEREAKETKEMLFRIGESEAENYAEITIHLLEHKLRRSPLYWLRRLDERWLHT